MQDIILLAGLITIGWYWWDTSLCKEISRQAGKIACQNIEVQFLDDTVEQKKLWIRRNESGRLELCRLFLFEFATDGEHRYQGRVLLLGKKVSDVDMDAYRIP